MTPIDLLLRIGATWLLAYSFTQLGGPLNIFLRARERRAGRWHGRFSIFEFDENGKNTGNIKITREGILDCIICTATWIGVIVMLAPDGVLLQGFGIAGLGMMLHSYTGWKAYS